MRALSPVSLYMPTEQRGTVYAEPPPIDHFKPSLHSPVLQLAATLPSLLTEFDRSIQFGIGLPPIFFVHPPVHISIDLHACVPPDCISIARLLARNLAAHGRTLLDHGDCSSVLEVFSSS